jgi:hypothetical protein
MKSNFGLETVDEFPYNNKEERKEAKRCLNEYRISDPSANFYMSSRPCKEWVYPNYW